MAIRVQNKKHEVQISVEVIFYMLLKNFTYHVRSNYW